MQSEELKETAGTRDPIVASGGKDEYTIGILVGDEGYACVDLSDEAALSLYTGLGKWLNRNAEQTWVCAGGEHHGENFCGDNVEVEGYKFGFGLTTGNATVKVLVPA